MNIFSHTGPNSVFGGAGGAGGGGWSGATYSSAQSGGSGSSGSGSGSTGSWTTEDIGNNYVRPGFDKAKQLFQSNSGMAPYQGQRVADFTGQQNQYFNQVGNQFGQTPAYLRQAQSQVGNVAQSGGMSQGIQQNLQGLQNIANSDAYKAVLAQQLDDVQNRINAQASGAGRYGSGSYTNVMTNELGDVTARALLNNQAQQMQALNSGLQGNLAAQGQGLQAAGMAPMMQQAEITRLNELLKSGSIQQSQNQDVLNAQKDLFDENRLQEWENLSRYMNAIGSGGVGGYASQPMQPMQTMQQNRPSTAQSVLGGAMTGASLGGMFGSPLLGALGGGLAGLFG